MNDPHYSPDNMGDWLKQMRERLQVPQSRLAAYLTVKLGTDHNQARICEFESGEKPIPAGTRTLMSVFFQQIEQLRQAGRPWKDVFFL